MLATMPHVQGLITVYAEIIFSYLLIFSFYCDLFSLIFSCLF